MKLTLIVTKILLVKSREPARKRRKLRVKRVQRNRIEKIAREVKFGVPVNLRRGVCSIPKW